MMAPNGMLEKEYREFFSKYGLAPEVIKKKSSARGKPSHVTIVACLHRKIMVSCSFSNILTVSS